MDPDDYMSDFILTKCVEADSARKSNKIVRKKPKVELKQPNISLRELEKQKREDGLSSEIPPENKGFKLLQKMGYVQNSGLGKHGEGITEPINIQMRVGRKGFGHESNLKRKHRDSQNAKIMAENLWASNLKDKFNEKLLKKDFLASQKACEQLDAQHGISVPQQKMFWPQELLPEPDTDESGAEDETFDLDWDKLSQLTEYLRSSYFYCVWCGNKYRDQEDLDSSCPGKTSIEHDI